MDGGGGDGAEVGSPLKMANLVAYKQHRPTMPERIPPFWRTLIAQCWAQTPESRPTFAQIIASIQDFKQRFGNTPLWAERDDHLHSLPLLTLVSLRRSCRRGEGVSHGQAAARQARLLRCKRASWRRSTFPLPLLSKSFG
jgi:hypothetical protein